MGATSSDTPWEVGLRLHFGVVNFCLLINNICLDRHNFIIEDTRIDGSPLLGKGFKRPKKNIEIYNSPWSLEN